MLTAYCLLLTAYRLLLTAPCLLLTAPCLLLTAYRSLLTAYFFSIFSNSSAVFWRMRLMSFLDSTFRRMTGSVLDSRRLKRHDPRSRLRPSVMSVAMEVG